VDRKASRLRGFGKHDIEEQDIYGSAERLSCLKESLHHRVRHLNLKKIR
jgi:hypothetical protein